VIGLTRLGANLSHSSGDFVIAFSTNQWKSPGKDVLTVERIVINSEARVMDVLFEAVAEAVEEAVLNSLSCAETTKGRDGNTAHELPLDKMVEILEAKLF
jgi:D-aminopeptidase